MTGKYFGRKLPALSSQDFSQDRPVVTPSDFAQKGLHCENSPNSFVLTSKNK
jgi:hypothetical protein